ncbi:hypothetical protein J6590_016793 [Homalodisca vitripennis]|nr:hypothetical protein J6590_016793 [Homalodisca vitripennis]
MDICFAREKNFRFALRTGEAARGGNIVAFDVKAFLRSVKWLSRRSIERLLSLREVTTAIGGLWMFFTVEGGWKGSSGTG